MGVYAVTLPDGAYSVQNDVKTRIVVADNSTDALAMAIRSSSDDGAPWPLATATLISGATDFSRLKFSITVTHDSDNGLGVDKTFNYQPLSTDAIADIGAGLAAAAVAAGLTGANYYTTGAVHKVQLPSALNCGKSVITSHAPVWKGLSAGVLGDVPGGNQFAIGGNDFPDYTLTGTSIKPTPDAASGSTVALARYIDLAPLLAGINPGTVAEAKEWF